MKTLKGIDISNCQTGLDYTTMARSLDFVIIQSSYGTSTRNPLFLTHVNGFRAARIGLMAAYHFIYAINEAQARQNAQNAIRCAKEAGLPKDTYIFCDLEYHTVEEATKQGVILTDREINRFTEIFCEEVVRARYRTGIYTNLDYYQHYYDQALLDRYPLWLCDLRNVTDPLYPCLVWQYSWQGRVPGYGGDLDSDYWYESGEDDKMPDTDEARIETEAQAIDCVLNIAADEVGYHEKASEAGLDSKTANAGHNNYTKYGKEMHKIQPSNMDYPAAWCDCFVDWCFYMAFGADLARRIICGTFDDYTVNSADMYKQAGRWTATPARGHQVFFTQGGICHTGLVEKVEGGYVYTIEGNKSDQVMRARYAIGDEYIAGYGRPRYDLAVGGTTPVPDKPSGSGGTINKTPKWVGMVTASQLNVRTWAGIEYPNIKSWPILERGNLVDVCDTVPDSNGDPWYYIRIAGQYYGFASAKYIKSV